jgi:hypothetical protein
VEGAIGVERELLNTAIAKKLKQVVKRIILIEKS